VAILALGFFPAVIFAWAFEMTPEGLKRDSEVDHSQSIVGHTGKKLNVVTILMVIAAVAFVAVERYLPGRNAAAPATVTPVATPVAPAATAPVVADSKSIAVLPFANRSNQADDLFFTDGIHDDLLTQLAKIHDLTVISRTSVMEYRDTRKNLKEIGGELNVGNILEGGIQKVGDRVRINAQLIEVATDKHLWAETFDRELTAENIFDIQSEIARKIVQAIAVELTPEEERRLSEVPTQNLAAYEAYLRSREIFYGANYTRSQEAAAQPWLEKAIELDPDYAEAYAQLANIYGQTYWRGIDTSEAFLAKYRATIARALELNPNSPSALRAQANYHYRVENDYETSARLQKKALENAPGDVDLHGDRGLSLRRLGRFDESIASFKRALQIDPANRFYYQIMVETMVTAGRWEDILENTVPLADADPDDLDSQIDRAIAQLNLTGDLEPLERVFKTMNLIDSSKYFTYSARVHMLRRDPDAAIEVLNNALWSSTEVPLISLNNRDFELAKAWQMKGDEDTARMHYERVIESLEDVENSALQRRSYGGMQIAISMARLGRFDEALELAARLANDPLVRNDNLLWGRMQWQLGLVKALAGETNEALEILRVSLETPSAFRPTVWDLYYGPEWDFMRDDPRFVELATPPVVIRTTP